MRARVEHVVFVVAATLSCGARSELYVPGAASPDASAAEPIDGARDATRARDADASRDASAHDATRGSGHDAGRDADVTRDAPRDVARETSPPDAPGDALPRDSPPEGSPPPHAVVPRQIAPLSTSRVTRRTPTLRWVQATAHPDVTLDLCNDRACMLPIASGIPVSGTSYTPTVALPVGVVYWRLHPATLPTLTSPTWEFTVGAGDARVDASWGTTFDVDGDGHADLVVGSEYFPSPVAGSVYVFLGSSHGLGTTPSATLTAPDASGGFGTSVASAGDVNGDGYADLIVGELLASNTEIAYLYLGSASGLATTPAATLTAPDAPQGELTTIVASAGDVDGDGYADVVVGANSPRTAATVFLYRGSANGLATTPAATLTAPAGANALDYGQSVAGAGDVNGDGYADVVVGNSTAVSAYVYLGSAGGLALTPTATLGGSFPMLSNYGVSVAGAGDVNGDGYADVIVGDDLNATAYVYTGSAAGVLTAPAVMLASPEGPTGDERGNYGAAVASAGDLNDDGYSDVVVGAPNVYGRVYLYLGGMGGLTTTASVTLNAPGGEFTNFGISVCSAGDVNSDGYADVVVGADTASSGSDTGTVYVFLGPGGTSDAGAPATTLTGMAMHEHFGTSVFGATN